MKKKIMIFLSIILIIIGVILIILLSNKSKEYFITDYELLYDIAVKYIVDNDNNPEKSNERYKMFTEYKGFDITEDANYRYAYMWISEESYYIKNDKIISSSGSSMPYKFIFAKNGNKVIKYKVPEDGSRYVSSIKEMFPKAIVKKILKYQYNDKRLKKEVKEYYSDLKDTTIYYSTSEE